MGSEDELPEFCGWKITFKDKQQHKQIQIGPDEISTSRISSRFDGCFLYLKTNPNLCSFPHHHLDYTVKHGVARMESHNAVVSTI